uniref:pleckstrin homology domain-containing family A member 6-like n=1 Tax=Myxine glutinosa TaxID=7769 RepID=UPI00358E6C5F
MCTQRWRRDDADIRMLELAVRDDGDEADQKTWSMVNQEEKQMLFDEVEPDYFNLNLTKELVTPDMVPIPERYVESEVDEPASPQELEARRRAVARIHNILTRSSGQNVMQQDDMLQSSADQERKISMSYELAAEASRRGKAVAARGSTLPRPYSKSSW